MVRTVMILGALAEATAWALVAMRKGTVWTAVTPVLAVLGVVTLLVEVPPAADRVEIAAAVGVGIVAGVVLYLATRVFAYVVRRWRRFATQSRAIYERRQPLSRAQAVAVTTFVAAPAEELFWRGLVQSALMRRYGRWPGAAMAAAAYGGVHVTSGNFTLLGAAGVAGAHWSALYAAGVPLGALIVSHVAWDIWIFLVQPTGEIDVLAGPS
jgi:membrane protease YdiL (CAAX protease family)